MLPPCGFYLAHTIVKIIERFHPKPFTRVVHKYVLNTPDAPSSLPRAGNTAVNKDVIPAPRRLVANKGRQVSKQAGGEGVIKVLMK